MPVSRRLLHPGRLPGAVTRTTWTIVALLSTAQAAAQMGHGQHTGKPEEPAQHEGMNMPMTFAGIPDSREASGTAWQPDDTPMHAHHGMRGEWSWMTHYNVFAAYDDQSGPRGDEQFNSVNWFMLMATRQSPRDRFTLRTMLSLEPLTTTRRGYPLLFQSGEAYQGQPLVDRQHPHDLFMELAGLYRHATPDDTMVSLYVAPAGEPALGPAAFPHRMSAMDNPAAPISHHWIDSTHISFGVLTAGVARGPWQVEGSWFNGREPDDDRWDIEKPELDSYAGRISWNPSPAWSLQVSHGYLDSPEELHPDEHLRRTTASAINLKKLGEDRHLATTVAWGRNDHGDSPTDAFLIETNYMTKTFSLFARAEHVEKTGGELELLPEDRVIRVRQLSAGFTRELVSHRPYQLAVGLTATYSFIPDDLDSVYGKDPVGFWVFLRLRPAAMQHGH